MPEPSPAPLNRWSPLVLAYLLFLLALSVDIVLLQDVGLLAEGPPNFEPIYLIRTALVAASSGLVVWGVVRVWHQGPGSARVGQVAGPDAGGASDTGLGRIIPRKLERGIIWGLLSLSAGFVLLFLYDARAFYDLGREDKLVEIISALAWFVSAVLFFRIARFVYRQRGTLRNLTLLIAGLLALACFLVSMEEISWFQRFLSYETPEVAGGNLQDEFNLHNFATDQVENVYYFAIFMFLVALPFLFSGGLRRSMPTVVTMFIPGRLALAAGALAVAYNYDMWNILFTQLSFFTTLFILGWLAWRTRRAGGDPSAWVGLILTLGVTQAIFLSQGSAFIRIWDVTEYKEFFIPLGMFFYALTVQARIYPGARQTIAAEIYPSHPPPLAPNR